MILPLKDQLSNLELSKHLKELGIKQESLWWWYILPSLKQPKLIGSFQHDEIFCYSGHKDKYLYSAFTVAELGEMLPETILINGESYHHTFWKTACEYIHHNNMNRRISYQADTEANARAKMLIYLLENKLMKG